MERKGFIGGSDCNRIMSGDWLKLWSEKKGYTEPSDLSDILAVQLKNNMNAQSHMMVALKKKVGVNAL